MKETPTSNLEPQFTQNRFAPDLPEADLSASEAKGVSFFERWLFRLLALVAMVYAFLAGLRTVSDFDIFWQLATGRWVYQHHHVFSTDVFSYTAYGQPWIYPVGSALLFFATYAIGGYRLISVMAAAAGALTVALLLRRGSVVSATIAILAVPLIAYRTVPRADIFTVVLFAALLSLLWENYQTGRASLWSLPLFTMAWVNLHLGFVAGLALMLAFGGMDLLEMLFGGTRREKAGQRLKRELPWFAAAAFATLVNPWGWTIYQTLFRQDRAMAQHSQWLSEWFALPLNWTVIGSTLNLRQTDGAAYLVLGIALLAAMIALLKRQPGPAVLLLASVYQSVRHVRMEALTACVTVVVGGAVLFEALQPIRSRIRDRRIFAVLVSATAILLVSLVGVRSADLISNRHYYRTGSIYSFGTGLGWWLPQGAANYVASNNLKGQVFNTYEEGGYLSWSLGPGRRDYIDGRAIPFGPEGFRRQQELQLASLDSAMWREEADRYDIEVFILPLARFEMLSLIRLHDFCESRDWRPVYLDELSAVFVRRKPETEQLIAASQVNCATAPLPKLKPGQSSAGTFEQWANAAGVLGSLGRENEALAAAEKALAIFPDSSDVHWIRGNILSGMGNQQDAEKEFRAAVTLDPSQLTWNSLGDFCYRNGRLSEALRAKQKAVRLSYQPHLAMVNLAQYYLQILEPKAALRTLDDAVQRAPAGALAEVGRHSFRFDVARARAGAFRTLGDLKRATAFEEEAVQLAPDAGEAWSDLAKLYEQQGKPKEQQHAQERASELAKSQALDPPVK